jgi:hypothetical protein
MTARKTTPMTKTTSREEKGRRQGGEREGKERKKKVCSLPVIY